ncbi:MAG: rane metalloprotease [Firmicutes bacterium]|nr:rane metalloprotease [Bacillota bacterium]
MLTELMTMMDWGGLASLMIKIAAIMLCVVVHEMSHGYAAYLLGDPTAKAGHRLSLNPLRHIDPFGLLMMFVVGFGWAKPVPVDPSYFRKPKSGMAITAFAGPLSNFIMAFIAALGLNAAYGYYAVAGAGPSLSYLIEFLTVCVAMNIGLGIFNLIPFPPLDGSKIFGILLPERTYFQLMRYESYGILILMALLWFGFLDAPLYAARSVITNVLFEGTQFMYTFMVNLLG